MGYDLRSIKATGKDGSYRLNIWAWRKLLSTACKYGWQPEGTTMPIETIEFMADRELPREKIQERIDSWEGTYFSNDNQKVSDKDAKGIREALKKALKDKKYTKDLEPEVIELVEGFIKFLKNGAFLLG